MLSWLFGRKDDASGGGVPGDVAAGVVAGPGLRGIPADLPTGPGGVFVFESEDARRINRARLEHLASLGLPLSGRRVLDVGAGVGILARFFVERGCRVLCVDGRADNIAVLREHFGDVDTAVADVQVDSLAPYGTFEVVFCYGLLYHLENPLAGLRRMAEVATDLMLIETMVCDYDRPVVAMADESAGTWNQSLSPLASRPSPAWVAMALSRLGFHVYLAKTAPDYEDYRFEWLNNGDDRRDGHNLRCVFVGSREALENPNLTLLATPNVAREQAG